MRLVGKRVWMHVILVGLMVVGMFAMGCEEETTAQPTPTDEATPTDTPTPADTGQPVSTDEAPPLPPSFVIPFDSFKSSYQGSAVPAGSDLGLRFASLSSPRGSQGSEQGEAAFGDTSTWGFAAFGVGVWSAIAIVGTAIPAAAFVASFHNNFPALQPDGAWLWDYSVPIAGKTYTAELYGRYVDEVVQWDMYVSQQGGFTDFKWIAGVCDREATEGYWILKESPTKDHDLIQIDWEIDREAETSFIKYTNVRPGDAENGGFISYRTTNDSPYNAFFDIFDKGADNHTYIEWNRTSEDGQVKDARHFKDDNWHCWDGNHKNIECP